ncbi:MAG: 4-hydroxy-tetrahydrodipicolinate reductase [Cytophagales bacterium]|nr:4-hydroxy-tetrahydrodipicolinate reductase [Cytophagales bacterium]
MNILLLGYGKMGKAIEQTALKRDHRITCKINANNSAELQDISLENIDVAIEFTKPGAAYGNIKFCIEKNIPVVSGTTGWLDKKKEIDKLCKENDGSFFYASNFSIGVNLLFHFNKLIARMMNNYLQYNVSLEETHHTEKLDAPSGTAISLANDIIGSIDRKKKWVNVKSSSGSGSSKSEEVVIVSKRENNVPGTHIIKYDSDVDSIEISHSAHSRKGFAEGAVLAAEWMIGKKGVFGMEDMLGLDT